MLWHISEVEVPSVNWSQWVEAILIRVYDGQHKRRSRDSGIYC
jgi:hypothetical protein